MAVKIAVFRDMTPCNPVNINLYFREHAAFIFRVEE
jgi:hypothetical protein